MYFLAMMKRIFNFQEMSFLAVFKYVLKKSICILSMIIKHARVKESYPR